MSEPAGYVTDVPYQWAFQREMAPAWLDWVAILCGTAPPDRSRGFGWCDLGCGRGLTAILLAATHPAGRFAGVDLMPGHIASARRLAADAGVRNIEFHNADFAAVDLGDARFDYIVAHGVYAWIADDSRTALRRLIDRHLAPGGLVYLSYNAMPGWAADLPLQRLLLALGAIMPGDSTARFTAAAELVQRIAAAGAPSLAASPIAAQIASIEERHGRAYLAHEYLAPHWRPLFVSEVRQSMAELGLTPIGSATVVDNFDSFVLRAAERDALAGVADPDVRELVRDFLTHKRFRRDVFGRGTASLNDAEQRERLLAMRYALTCPLDTVKYAMRTPAGELKFDNPAARRIVAELATGPRRLSQSGADNALSPDVIASLLALCCGGAVQPVPDEDGSVAALNRQILSRAGSADEIGHLVLPCGMAVKAAPLLQRALGERRRPDDQDLAASFDFLDPFAPYSSRA